MSESIPDVILRLARRHLPVDAAMPNLPARPAVEPSELPIDAPTRSSREPDDAPTGERVPAASPEPPRATGSPVHETVAAASNPPTTAAEPSQSDSLAIAGAGPDVHKETGYAQPQFVVQASRLPSAGEMPAPQRTTTAQTDAPFNAASDANSFVAADPASERSDIPTPSFATATNPSYRPGRPPEDFTDDAFEPMARSATNAASSRDQSSVDAVGEASRQLEQTARDLETSLTRLFTTQIETLQRLRDRVDEQERRWVEQQSARRATL